MSSTKYMGMDVHTESISIAVRNSVGKLVMECVIETKASTIVQFINGLRGDLRVPFEEGTWATWLYDLLKPHVTEVLVCNTRKNASGNGSKSDRIDARKLSEQLYMNTIKSVYHGEHGLRTLKELARSYLTISKDLTRVMNRLKALYRSWGIPCGGKEVYAPRHRAEWLAKITEAGVRRRAEHYYQQLDFLRPLRQEARRDLLLEAKKHKPWKLLRLIPGIGPIRAAIVIAVMQTPHRFRTKRHLWTYSGLALETHDSAQYRVAEGQLQRSKKPTTVRGLNKDHNHDLKEPMLPACESPEPPYALPDNRRKPLGQEPPIGPCIATLEWTIIRLAVSETDGRRHDSEMGTTGARKQSLRPISWAECREKKIGIEPKGSTFFLTFPLIGLF
jgi:transposase